jgi:hypothetical membrane protein
MIRPIAFYAGILGVLFFVVTTILAGLQFQGYSHISQYISELYATGTPYGPQLRYYGFIPSGILIMLFSFLAIKLLPKSALTAIGFLGIGIFYGGGTIVCSLFPCDAGCNREWIDPSISQLIHNLSGTLTYLVVPISLVLAGVGARKWNEGKRVSFIGIFAGVICILFVGVLSSNPMSEYVGLFQRIIESSVLLWITWCSFYLRKIVIE